MSELYMMVTITNRQLTRKFVECYKEKGAQVGSVTVGMGTAANEILDYFGLDGMEKSVLFHLVTDAAWRQIKAALRKKMKIDLPGMGIAFIIPVSSVGGKKALNYLTCGQEFVKGEESTLKETKNELLVALPRLIRRTISSSSGTSRSTITETSCPLSANIFFNASACAIVLGKPSKITPLLSLKLSNTLARISIINSSGIN